MYQRRYPVEATGTGEVGGIDGAEMESQGGTIRIALETL